MRSRIARGFVAVAAVAYLTFATPLGAVPDATHPFAGITYTDRVVATPRAIHMHVVQVDLTTPGIRFTLSPPAGSREVVRQTTLQFLQATHAQVAINAHFFWPWPTTDTDVVVIGIAASEGRVFSAFESPEQTYAILPDAPGLNIDRQNHATIVHRDPSQPDRLHVVEPLSLWTTVSGSAQVVTDGVVTVPAYKDATHPAMVLLPGGPGNYSNDKSWYDVATARRAIGLSRDSHTLTLFTVDVKGESFGMKMSEVATTLVNDFHVWNALSLDGGGSTSMAMEDSETHVAKLVNVPSDGVAGRAVGTSLAVFAQRLNPR